MSSSTARGMLFRACVAALLFFSQHAVAQQPACSEADVITYNLETREGALCVQQLGPNAFFNCMQAMTNRLNQELSESCVAALRQQSTVGSGNLTPSPNPTQECLKRCTGLPRNVPCRCP
jgi:hypothetical protein